MTFRLGVAAVAALGLSICAGGVQASQLYGADFGAPGGFYDVDTGTGAGTTIGAIGNTNIGDLTSDTRPGQNIVYGVDLTANALVTFDVTTGLIASTQLISGAAITSIAFDPTSGLLFGNQTGSFSGDPTGQLFTINTATGAASLIGATGVSDIFALAFDQGGALFGVDAGTNNLLSIDTGTGASSVIGSTGLGFSFDIASDPEDGTMYLADSGRRSLFTIDTATAAVTLVGGWGAAPANIAGLAFTAPIPIPGALPMLMGGLAALGYLRRRRH